MAMKEIRLSYPEELLISLKESEEGLAKTFRVLTAVKLYELGKLSLGKAAKLAKINRIEFIRTLSEYRVSIFQMTEDELEEDIKNARAQR